MTQLLASIDDVRHWLPEDKLPVSGAEASTGRFQIEAYRLIKGQLAGVFTPVILTGWDSPSNTPSIIRGIAGRLIAAYLYRERYSEDSNAIPAYAQQLYNEAIELLSQIRTGAVIVLDDSNEPISANELDLAATDFWPNDSTAGPYFKMDQVFG